MQSKEFNSYTQAHLFMQHVQKTGNSVFYIGTNLQERLFTVHWRM